jgi:hypothetical protein
MPQNRPCQPDVQRQTFGPTQTPLFAHPPLHTVFRAWTCLGVIVYDDADDRWLGWSIYVRYTGPAATHESVQQGARREILKADTDNAQATVPAHSESQFTRHLHALKQHTAALTLSTAIPYLAPAVEKWLRHYLQQHRVSVCMAMGA